MMKELTKAEEQVMQYVWKLEKAFLKDIVEQFPEPKPAYTTISTVIRVLVKKGFIGHNTYGKVHEYYPQIEKKEYTRVFMGTLIKNFFNNSSQKFMSFFTSNDEMSVSELEELRNMLDEQIEKRKTESNE